jgi:flagella basal body P-ring formation protein FlgA
MRATVVRMAVALAVVIVATLSVATRAAGAASDAGPTEGGGGAPARVQANDLQSLRAGLLAVAEEQLRPSGLFIDRDYAWLSLSATFPGPGTFEVRPRWDAGAGVPPLPLRFELVSAGSPPLRAALSVKLSRDVWVTARRLRKGSAASCDDLESQRRDVRSAPDFASASGPRAATNLPTCDIPPGSVALRDMAAGDVVRTGDVGKALDVVLGTPVDVSVAIGGINVTVAAVSLADARVGDEVDVRLQRPARVLRTQVVGPGSVQLTDRSL